MNVDVFINNSTKKLRDAGVRTAHLDTLLLLEDLLKMNRTYLLAHPEIKLTKSNLIELNKSLESRLSHTPMAYLRGLTDFYGHNFNVNESVLIPRPETETLVEETIKLVNLYYSNDEKVYIADIGTGSGCIGISLSLALSNAIVDLYDLDKAALKVASHNKRLLNASIRRTYNEDLLLGANNREYQILTANLPYIPDKMPLNSEARHEPKQAIFSGSDGLTSYRAFFAQLKYLKFKPSFIVTESLPVQHKDLQKMANDPGYKLLSTYDFVQVFKLD